MNKNHGSSLDDFAKEEKILDAFSIMNHIEKRWSSWEERPEMFFISKEALVCSIMTDLDILDFIGLIKIDRYKDHISFFETRGCQIIDLNKIVDKENAHLTIQHARDLVEKLKIVA